MFSMIETSRKTNDYLIFWANILSFFVLAKKMCVKSFLFPYCLLQKDNWIDFLDISAFFEVCIHFNEYIMNNIKMLSFLILLSKSK